MSGPTLGFLRPYLWRQSGRCSIQSPPAYRRVYSASLSTIRTTQGRDADAERSDVRDRIQELRDGNVESYPRIREASRPLSCEAFRHQYASLKPDEKRKGDVVTIRGRTRPSSARAKQSLTQSGRVHSSRIAGSKLVFLDLVQNGTHVQALCNQRTLEEDGVTPEDFRRFYRIARRGDIYSVTGIPHRTPRGELSIVAAMLPELLTPSLHQLPTELLDKATRIRNRHVDLLVNRQTADTLKLRSHVVQCLREFFLQHDFLEVETPILADGAGGAIARPFVTAATEFPEKKLALRIAPELWLKRLIMGDFDRVFEIGPSFRNEGLDPTHNPEFTTCEFYQTFASIDDLIGMSEKLMSHLARRVQLLKDTGFPSLPPLDIKFDPPFRRVDFIPAIQSAIDRTLPNLSAPEAKSDLLKLFQDLDIPPPTNPTLPRLLDKLSSVYLEPQCSSPTFITNHPECLSPLSKSFLDRVSGQRISARVELFVQRREILNAYEEENSPFEQRRKFEEQLTFRDPEAHATVDASYLEALEWGLPPTGGWGCGVDRLVMLFTGAPRIGDVLSFGNLRNVVGLGREASHGSKPS